jgi:hypothetical protein
LDFDFQHLCDVDVELCRQFTIDGFDDDVYGLSR